MTRQAPPRARVLSLVTPPRRSDSTALAFLGFRCDTAAAAAPGPSGEERTGRRSGEEEEEEEHAGMDAPVAVAVPPQPQPQPQPPPAPAAAPPYRWSRAVARSPAAWMRLGVGGLLVGSIIFAFYEWGLPLLSEKVLLLPSIFFPHHYDF